MVWVRKSGKTCGLKTLLMPYIWPSLEAHFEILIRDPLRCPAVENPVEIRNWSKADD
jgi:hypothetical protein